MRNARSHHDSVGENVPARQAADFALRKLFDVIAMHQAVQDDPVGKIFDGKVEDPTLKPLVDRGNEGIVDNP